MIYYQINKQNEIVQKLNIGVNDVLAQPAGLTVISETIADHMRVSLSKSTIREAFETFGYRWMIPDTVSLV